MNRTCLTYLVLFLLFGCSRDVNTEHRFRSFQENGITIAETTGGPKYAEELFQYEQILVLHEDPLREESLLFGPIHFFMDENSYFYVADRSDGRIVVFNAEGQYSHSFGREGSGPGEFRQMAIQTVQNGIVSIWDFAQRRTTRFSTDGRLHDVTPLPLSTADQLRGLIHLPDENLLVLSMEIPVEEDRWEYEQAHATCFSSNGDSLWSLDFGWVKNRFINTVSAGGVEYPWPEWYQYAPRPWCTYDLQGHIYYTDGSVPIVDVYDSDGEHIQQIRLGLIPEPSSTGDEERVRSFIRSQIDQATNDRLKDRWKSDLDKLRFPARKALWQGITVDDAGYIWLQESEHRLAVFDNSIPTFTYIIVSPEGEFLGKTTHNKDSRIRISRGHMLEIQNDQESGERTLVVHAIRPLVQGLDYHN